MNRLFLGVLLIGAVGRAPLTSVGPLVSEIRGDLGLSSAAAGLLTTLPLLAFAVFSLVAPLAAGRAGLERSLAIALLLLAGGIAVRSLPAQLWAGTIAVGAAIACFNVLLPSVVKRDFPDRVAPVTGGYSATQSVVAAVASGTAVPLAAVAGGWRWALASWAMLVVVAIAVWAPSVREAGPGANGAARAPLPWRSALAWQVTLFMGLQSLAFYVLITWLPTIERDHGIDPAVAGWHLFAYLAAAVAANLLVPLFMRGRADQRLVGLGCAVCIGAGVAGQQWLPWNPWWALASVLVAGFGAGMAIVVCLSLFSLRTTDARQAAALSAMAQSTGYGLAAGGPVLIGALRDAAGSWTAPVVVLCGLTLAMAAVAWLSGRPRTVA
ncbi:MFS transporter [Dactylosporangium sp. AC04546]|uniref:CynX/NimT family MFS transporter n=1 Tax=Dactylosporangium sp. AC04546 TaxID=2862460 RepID=UPI001EDCC1FB|nr:MFS transporter [Dactylosporangium sp. AC04546]WVK78243.1 MFS transporter [Dactylosporangium sp. AC04546]